MLFSPPVSREVFKSGSRELSALEKEKTMSPVPDAGKNKMADSVITGGATGVNGGNFPPPEKKEKDYCPCPPPHLPLRIISNVLNLAKI